MSPFTYMVNLFVAFFRNIIDLLSEVKFDLLGYEVNLFAVMLSFVILGFLVNIFWRGVN